MEDALIICDRLRKYLGANSEIRFGQALFNLGINQFAEIQSPKTYNQDLHLRDIYNDSDIEILKRINNG